MVYDFNGICADPYRFGFNGQMKVNEIAGVGNHNTALFWEYDTRLGRRWNLDPVDQISISNYAAFANNPILNIDLLGDKVKNGDRLASENYTKAANNLQISLNGYMEKNGISDDMSRNQFLKSGGSKKVWNKYKSISNQIAGYRNSADYHSKQAEVTDKIISNWQKDAPILFSKIDGAISSVNGENVDFLIFSFQPVTESDGREILGSNEVSYDGTMDKPILSSKKYGYYQENAVDIRISQNVTTNKPQNSRHGFQYLLNHEAGHFSYIVEKTADYIKFMAEQKQKGIYSDGGHSKNDESGKRAVKYGETKDFKK